MSNYIAGGVGKALMFLGDELYGVAKTLSDNTFDFTITAEDIRGGKKNVLLGQYFHDSNLSINLTNALFNFEDIALAIGSPIEHGGLSVKEEQVTAGEGTLTATSTPIAVGGKILGWYKKPSDKVWKVGTFEGKEMSVPGAKSPETYCLKYFWNNENARSVKIRADYEPSELHLVIIQDLFTTDVKGGDVKPGEKAGSLITDIPRFKLDGALNLGFAAGSTATTSISGNALAAEEGDNCEENFIYGTMTEEISNAKWQDDVVAIAVENSEIELGNSDTETLIVRVIYGNGGTAQRKDNSNFTFTSDAPETASVGENDGVVTGGSSPAETHISVALTGHMDVDPAYVKVTVS